ncbi:MAG TPA: hydroxysqualene dehydroxylase HpnE [Solirubrobacteraceae bacterium]
MSERRVLVVGGGLAGITAALDCAAGGMSVTLVDVRPRLGGAAYSFERDGLWLDNGQHVFLRCCTAYRALLQRIGSSQRVRLQERLEIPVLKPHCDPVWLRRSALPAPLHLAGTLLRYKHLRVRERLAAIAAAQALRRLEPGEGRLEEQTFGQWLGERGQGEHALAALWDLIALPTLNLPARDASLALSAFVFKTALFAARDAGDIGFHERPLSEVIGEPALEALRGAGVQVKLKWRAQSLQKTAEGVELRGGEQEGLSAEAAIIALPHQRAAGLLGDALAGELDSLAGLGNSPIVNLHLIYDRPVCEFPFAAGVGTPIQYVFDRTAAARLASGQYLAISLSGATQDAHADADRLRERYLPAMAELFPRAREAKLEGFFVSREHAATFRAAPGSAALRPGPATSLAAIALAGSWTDTGWPATLEGAVLSGHAAAAQVLL